MSITIKSNNLAVNNFGSVKMIGTTAQAEFDKYKARVLADGGVIKDEARTLAAFNLLFDTKMYGNMNTAVSGAFGVKMSGVGIAKLYAIDGDDLVGAVYGTGSLPTLDANNNISFAANSTTVNGGMFSTVTKKILSKVGNFGFAVKVDSSSTTSALTTVAAVSLHADETANSAIAKLAYNGVSVLYTTQKDPLNLSSPTYLTAASVVINADSYNPVAVRSSTLDGKLQFSKAGALVNAVPSVQTGQPFSEIKTKEFYIDFGGEALSTTKSFTNAVIKDFMSFNQATAQQAAQLSGFK